MLAEDLLKLLSEAAPAVIALAEAFRGGATSDELVASIRAGQIKATEIAVEADLGERPPQ